MKRFFVLLAVLICSIAVAPRLALFVGMVPDLPLVALMTAAVFLPITELAVIIVLAVLLLNWQPGASVEMAMLFILPVLWHVAHRAVPASVWVSQAFVMLLSLAVFYAASYGPAVLLTALFAKAAVWALAAGLVFYVSLSPFSRS